MLSILIPVRNYDASTLVESFRSLALSEGVDVEIIVADDASTSLQPWLDHLEAANSTSTSSVVGSSSANIHILRSSTNLGRARNINRLADAAHSEWLLIVDCDAAIPSDFSLRRYLEAAISSASVEGHPVVCGGLLHPDVNPCPEATLRYTYERAADLYRSADHRNRAPYAQLSTFSILIRRDIFLNVGFDEECTDYGYEDTLFGAELQRRNIPILHIDNPLLHLGLEPNDIYLSKTETALQTLHRLAPRLENHSHLLAVVGRLSQLHLTTPVRLLYRLLRPLLRRNLLSSHPNLKVFAFYKLGYYLSLF